MPLTSSVEKVVILYGFKLAYKPKSINVYLVSVDHNGMAVCLTRSDCEGF